MPKAMVRLSAGRASMNDETQALCYLAGANSIFLGEKLLTTGNPDIEEDMNLMKRLGLHPMHPDEARRVHRGEIAPADAKPAEWPSVAEFAAANAAEESCGTKAAAAASKPMAVIFVTGSDTGVGKTHVAGLLARRLARDGFTQVIKPVESGAGAGRPADAKKAAGKWAEAHTLI